mgnify:CR=1 FL=1
MIQKSSVMNQLSQQVAALLALLVCGSISVRGQIQGRPFLSTNRIDVNIGSVPNAVVAGDLDGDAAVDIVIAAGSSVAVCRNTTKGTGSPVAVTFDVFYF